MTRPEALAALYGHLAALAEQGHRAPCLNTKTGHWWTSDDPALQELAAARCGACPALAACRSYTTEHKETGGVWAGRIPRKKRNRS